MNANERFVIGLRDEIGGKLIAQYEGMLRDKLKTGVKNAD